MIPLNYVLFQQDLLNLVLWLRASEETGQKLALQAHGIGAIWKAARLREEI
jgi:hypothetical protein